MMIIEHIIGMPLFLIVQLFSVQLSCQPRQGIHVELDRSVFPLRDLDFHSAGFL